MNFDEFWPFCSIPTLFWLFWNVKIRRIAMKIVLYYCKWVKITYLTNFRFILTILKYFLGFKPHIGLSKLTHFWPFFQNWLKGPKLDLMGLEFIFRGFRTQLTVLNRFQVILSNFGKIRFFGSRTCSDLGWRGSHHFSKAVFSNV